MEKYGGSNGSIHDNLKFVSARLTIMFSIMSSRHRTARDRLAKMESDSAKLRGHRFRFRVPEMRLARFSGPEQERKIDLAFAQAFDEQRIRRFYDQHPQRAEYVIAARGRELRPRLKALKDWGDRHTHP